MRTGLSGGHRVICGTNIQRVGHFETVFQKDFVAGKETILDSAVIPVLEQVHRGDVFQLFVEVIDGDCAGEKIVVGRVQRGYECMKLGYRQESVSVPVDALADELVVHAAYPKVAVDAVDKVGVLLLEDPQVADVRGLEIREKIGRCEGNVVDDERVRA